MPCDDTMRESQRLAFEAWKAEQWSKCRAAYSPLMPPDDALYNAILADMRRQNKARERPDPVCKKCGFPMDDSERDPLFQRRCSTCGARHLDELLRRTRRHLGRKATIRALKRLAYGR
jgi:tRNA(Ile2) C34 agmatinyltransferase TiaS